jgi:hypothetical protein
LRFCLSEFLDCFLIGFSEVEYVVQMRLSAHQPAPESTRAPSMARAVTQSILSDIVKLRGCVK